MANGKYAANKEENLTLARTSWNEWKGRTYVWFYHIRIPFRTNPHIFRCVWSTFVNIIQISGSSFQFYVCIGVFVQRLLPPVFFQLMASVASSRVRVFIRQPADTMNPKWVQFLWKLCGIAFFPGASPFTLPFAMQLLKHLLILRRGFIVFSIFSSRRCGIGWVEESGK